MAALVLTMVVVWSAAKMVAISGWVIQPDGYSDTYYYFLTAEALARDGGGIADAFREYPTPAGLLLLVPWHLGATDHEAYRTAVIAMTTVADAVFAALLGRRLGPLSVLAWVALTSALGQLPLLRFDMLPAVVAGAAVLMAMEGRRVLASVLIGLGTGLKLWPIVLFPLALGGGLRRDTQSPDIQDASRRVSGVRRLSVGIPPPPIPALLTLGITGIALVVLSLTTGGWDRLLSPLGYQRDRGLQIEAVAATVPMVEWSRDDAFRVWFSGFHAYEVIGPNVDGWLAFAQGATVVGAVGCLVLLAHWLWRGANPQAVAWLALVLIGTFIVTSRALSPQYILWLAAPAAVLVGAALLAGPDAPPLAPALLTFALVLGLCALTSTIYPTYYGALLARSDDTHRIVLLLTLRNAGLLILVAWSAACALAMSRTRLE